MTRALRVTALLVPAIFLTGCDEIDFGGNSDRYKEDFHQTHRLPSGGRLSIENLNGSIEISAWEQDSVDISGTKHASTQQALQNTKIDIVPGANTLSIRTIPPAGWRGGVGARYVIRVPRRVELDRIISSNGSVKIDGIEGRSSVRTSNGSVRTTRTRGELEVTTSNGGMDILHAGNTRLHTSNGTIRAEVEKGSFEAESSNGGIIVKLIDPPGLPTRIESSNGHVEVSTNVATDLRASTSNSSITVRIPERSNVRLRAHTSNSSITTDFDVSVRGSAQSKNHLEGNIGSGGPLMDLSTTNGGIKVLRLN